MREGVCVTQIDRQARAHTKKTNENTKKKIRKHTTPSIVATT